MLSAADLRVELDADAGIVRAIDGLALTLARGETFALVGESGCGKSMTALALMRLLPGNGRVAGGSVRLAAAGDREARGVDLLALPEAAMRAVRGGRVGMIFQEPATSLNPVMRIGAQIVEAIEAHTPLRGAAARARAVEWLGRVGIPDAERRIDDYPFGLSGGQKQRVMIAMALAAEPDVLIADEPTTALDVTIQAQILDLLRTLQRERGLALLLITHDLAVVSGMAHRVALMYAGQIVEVADAADFFAAPRHPYARLLLQALPGAGRRGAPLAAIPGSVPPLTQAFAGCRFAPRCDRAFAPCPAVAPMLIDAAEGHAVRCLLYAPDAPAAGAVPGPQRRRDTPPGHATIRIDVGAPPVAVGAVGTGGVTGVTDATRATDATSATGAARTPGITGGVGTTSAASATSTTMAAAPAATTETVPLLDIDRLCVAFPVRSGVFRRATGAFQAVADVSLRIAAGRTLALVGTSGCGKTTLGKAVAQLLRGQATVSGQARLDGRDLFALHGRELLDARRAVQMVFQDPYASLDPRMRIADVLEEGLVALRGELGAAERRARIERLLDQVGLRRDALERYPHEFSGGQRQRIAIARALAVEPRLIVCDEPTSALDVSVQAQILNLLRDLQRTLGVAYLFITHNIGVVEFVADDVAVMRGGRLVESGPAAAVLGAPRSDAARELLAAVPRLAPVIVAA